jgi:hypothetical protein
MHDKKRLPDYDHTFQIATIASKGLGPTALLILGTQQRGHSTENGNHAKVSQFPRTSCCCVPESGRIQMGDTKLVFAPASHRSHCVQKCMDRNCHPWLALPAHPLKDREQTRQAPGPEQWQGLTTFVLTTALEVHEQPEVSASATSQLPSPWSICPQTQDKSRVYEQQV